MEFCYVFRRTQEYVQLDDTSIRGTTGPDERVFSGEMDMELVLRMAMASEGEGLTWATAKNSAGKTDFAFASKDEDGKRYTTYLSWRKLPYICQMGGEPS